MVHGNENFVPSPETDYVPEVYDIVVSKVFPTNRIGIVTEWHMNGDSRVPRVVWATGERSSPLASSLRKIPKDELLDCWRDHDTLVENQATLLAENKKLVEQYCALEVDRHTAETLVGVLRERLEETAKDKGKLFREINRLQKKVKRLKRKRPSADEEKWIEWWKDAPR